MAAGERVVFAFHGRGKGADAMQLAVGAELLAPPGEYLVPVGLMAHVPHDAVVGGIIYIM